MASVVSRPTLLMVHGSWHGSWCWQRLRAELSAMGWTTQTVDLPSAVRDDYPAERLPGMYDDARAVRDALDDVVGPVVVVAHSYGGVPVTQAAVGAANVACLIYLNSYLLDVGESVFTFQGSLPPPSSNGVLLPPRDASFSLYGDVSAEEAADAASRLVPQSIRAGLDEVTQAAWHTISSSYVICDNDQALSPKAQKKMAVRAGVEHHLASGHSPFLSMPGELARLLIRITDEIAMYR
jgi:pimeloyl-ACP methyl ester carboxylesterase